MLPIAISGIASLAETALNTWNRIAESRAAAKAQPAVDFNSLLEKASPARGAGANVASLAFSQSIQGRLAALPEVKSALGASVPGTQFNFSVTPNGELFQILPGGGQQQVALSAQSQALLRQCTGADAGPVSLGLQA